MQVGEGRQHKFACVICKPGKLSNCRKKRAETANGWLRLRLDSSAALVPKLWEETPAQFAKRLSGCVMDVNNGRCDIRGLCRSFPRRLAELKKAKGDRLSY